MRISGGEPLEKAEGLLELLRAARTQTGLSALGFSGYTLKQIQLLPLGQDVLGCVDVMIDGAGVVKDTLCRAGQVGSVTLFLGWVDCPVATDDEASTGAT